jgi:hypothetical protein
MRHLLSQMLGRVLAANARGTEVSVCAGPQYGTQAWTDFCGDARTSRSGERPQVQSTTFHFLQTSCEENPSKVTRSLAAHVHLHRRHLGHNRSPGCGGQRTRNRPPNICLVPRSTDFNDPGQRVSPQDTRPDCHRRTEPFCGSGVSVDEPVPICDMPPRLRSPICTTCQKAFAREELQGRGHATHRQPGLCHYCRHSARAARQQHLTDRESGRSPADLGLRPGYSAAGAGYHDGASGNLRRTAFIHPSHPFSASQSPSTRRELRRNHDVWPRLDLESFYQLTRPPRWQPTQSQSPASH